jgi:hypothetical protein
MKQLLTLVGAGLLLGALAVAPAQETKAPPKKAPASPAGKVEAVLGGKAVTITYGQPSKKDREIFGKLVPYGQVWRMGANERTKLIIDSDIMIGSLHVPKGSYSLWAIPTEKEWTLLVNKEADGWGAQWDYDSKIKANELGRVPMTVTKVPLTEQLTLGIKAEGSMGTLTVTWDTVQASVKLMMH